MQATLVDRGRDAVVERSQKNAARHVERLNYLIMEYVGHTNMATYFPDYSAVNIVGTEEGAQVAVRYNSIVVRFVFDKMYPNILKVECDGEHKSVTRLAAIYNQEANMDNIAIAVWQAEEG